MRDSGAQLSRIKTLVEAGVITPVIDRVFAFDATADALSYVEQGRSKDKVVVRLS